MPVAEIMSERLWENMAIKRELATIGFSDYEKMVAGAVNYPDRAHLHKKVDLGPNIGAQTDQVHFIVSIKKDAKGAFKEIMSIHAFYDSLFSNIAKEDTSMHVRFERRNGRFPAVEDMISSVVDRERNQLLRYRNAHRIAMRLQTFQNGLKKFIKPKR